MVKAIVEIDREANEVLNLTKARYGLKDKSQALNLVVKQYKVLVLESGVRLEYLKKLKKIRREPIIRVGSIEDFRERYGGK
jgi:hypothetical protein